jgi:hypothetical protein
MKYGFCRHWLDAISWVVQVVHLDPEGCELLRFIARPAAADGYETLERLVAKVEDWDRVLQNAHRHGVLPMLYSRIVATGVEIPRGAMEVARRRYEQNAFHCIANAAELLEVLKTFEEAAIPAIPFKGVVLASSAYASTTERAAGDLDVLIHYRDLKRATAILQRRGYELRTEVLENGSPAQRDYFEYHFERPSDGVILELRWRLELTQPRFRRKLGLEWVYSKRRTITLAGGAVPSLDPVSELLILCMHGTKHFWARLIWTSDVAMLIESQPDLDWDLAMREARRTGLWRTLELGVLLAHRMLGAEVPAEILRRFEADKVAVRLAEFFAEHLIGSPGMMPSGRIPFNVHLLGWQDRVQALFSPGIFRPGDRDLAFIQLPQALHPLYYVIRPIRLLLDRSGR